MAKIKICGLKREEDIAFVNELKPDYVGFILTDGFKRSIDRDTAVRLKSLLSKDIMAVGVFVNDSLEKINELVASGVIDTVQLHGNESPDYCRKINAPVIKYFNPEGFCKINEYDVDYFLFDNGTGTGKAFDWSSIPKTDKPFFLAGGLDENNIPLAIKKINPYCIDVSSSVETQGVKDFYKIKRIMECVK